MCGLIGPDPADPSRVLVRKIFQIGEKSYAYEETTVTPNKVVPISPSVHTIMTKIHDWDMKEDVSTEELVYRFKYQVSPTLIGFSMYYRKAASGANHFSIVENTMWKASSVTWAQWWSDLNDRRDISNYLRNRWIAN